jgi:hypothetical protein
MIWFSACSKVTSAVTIDGRSTNRWPQLIPAVVPT